MMKKQKSKIKLRNYQINAVKNLTNKISNLLELNKKNSIVTFQAPTGSGKTLMMSEVIKNIDELFKGKICFIWLSVRMLHKQSKEKLEEYYDNNSDLKCIYFDELTHEGIEPGNILFLNWESINKLDKNIFYRGRENNISLETVSEDIKRKELHLLLIIDESHHTASSKRSVELIEVLKPDVTVEVSATPQIKDNVFEIERVSIKDVCDEGMIKNNVIINPDLVYSGENYKTTNEFILKNAIYKLKEIKDLFRRENSNVNPLLLVQLPDNRNGLNFVKDEVIRVLNELGYSEDKGNLAVWLSEEKTDNLKDVVLNNSPVDVLVFKQAISLGWDCPRAHILVVFRESTNFVFTIQTIGRIMRMPELKHYSNPELNSAYIYTNLDTIKIVEDYINDYLLMYTSKRNDDLYNDINLVSTYCKTVREEIVVTKEYNSIFKSIFKYVDLLKNLNSNIKDIFIQMVSDLEISDVNKPSEIKDDTLLTVKLGSEEIKAYFDKFISSILKKYSLIDSNNIVKENLFKILSKLFNINKEEDFYKIVMDNGNKAYLYSLISKSLEEFRLKMKKNIFESKEVVSRIWNVPEFENYNKDVNKLEVNKSIMVPFYYSKLSDPEIKFIKLLEKHNNVLWWYKNGEHNEKYFSITYKEKDLIKNFFVDFIVMTKNGFVCLFDTKSGITYGISESKKIHLKRYIEDSNLDGKKICGGIVVYENNLFNVSNGDEDNNLVPLEVYLSRY